MNVTRVLVTTLIAHHIKNPDSVSLKNVQNKVSKEIATRRKRKHFLQCARKAIQHSTSEGLSAKETQVVIAVQCNYKVKVKKAIYTQQKG